MSGRSIGISPSFLDDLHQLALAVASIDSALTIEHAHVALEEALAGDVAVVNLERLTLLPVGSAGGEAVHQSADTQGMEVAVLVLPTLLQIALYRLQ